MRLSMFSPTTPTRDQWGKCGGIDIPQCQFPICEGKCFCQFPTHTRGDLEDNTCCNDTVKFPTIVKYGAKKYSQFYV